MLQKSISQLRNRQLYRPLMQLLKQRIESAIQLFCGLHLPWEVLVLVSRMTPMNYVICRQKASALARRC